MLLKKLIKTKQRAIRTPLMIACGVMLGIAVIAVIIGSISLPSVDSGSIFAVLGMMAYMFSALGIYAALVCGMVLIAYSVFEMYGTERAYLYFTLPVTRKQIFHAGIRSQLKNTVILGATGILSLIIYFIPMIVMSVIEFQNVDIPSTPSEPLSSGEVAGLIYFLILMIIMIIASLVYSAVSVSVSCIFGCSIAKKHKLLGSIIASMVISGVYSFVYTIIAFIIMIPTEVVTSLNPEASGIPVMNILYTSMTLVMIAITIIFYKVGLKRLEQKFDVD